MLKHPMTQEASSYSSIYILSTLLNFIQASELFTANERRHLLILNFEGGQSLSTFLNMDDWASVDRLHVTGTVGDLIMRISAIKARCTQIAECHRAVVGFHNNNVVNYLISSSKISDVVLLEDGLVSLIPDYYSRTTTKELIKQSLFKALGYDLRFPRRFTLCSQFKVSPLSNSRKLDITLREQTYSRLRGIIEEGTFETDVKSGYVMLQNYVELGDLPKAVYFSVIKSACEYLKTQGIVPIVCCHRRNNVNVWRSFCRIHDLELLETGGVIENYFISKRIRPKVIVSTGTAATYSLTRLFNPIVYLFLPPVSAFRRAVRGDQQYVYKHLIDSFGQPKV